MLLGPRDSNSSLIQCLMNCRIWDLLIQVRCILAAQTFEATFKPLFFLLLMARKKYKSFISESFIESERRHSSMSGCFVSFTVFQFLDKRAEPFLPQLHSWVLLGISPICIPIKETFNVSMPKSRIITSLKSMEQKNDTSFIKVRKRNHLFYIYL